MPPKEVCPSNPFFYGWIRELRDDAKEKDNKSHHSYSRAMKALKQYPIPLRSGEEAKTIQVLTAFSILGSIQLYNVTLYLKPLPFQSMKDYTYLTSLQFIGDKAGKYLDKKAGAMYKERGYSDSEIQHFLLTCPLANLPTIRCSFAKLLSLAKLPTIAIYIN